MTTAIVAMFSAVVGLTGCAFTGPITPQSAPASHVRILPNTAVKHCRSNGPICEPPATIYPGHFSGHVDDLGNISFDPPDGLPPP